LVTSKTPIQVHVNSARGSRHSPLVEQEPSRGGNDQGSAADGKNEAKKLNWQQESDDEQGLLNIVVNIHETGGDDEHVSLDDDVAHHNYV